MVQIQPGKYVLEHAGYTSPTRQHELYHTIVIGTRSALEDVGHGVGIDGLSVRGV